MNAFQTDRSLAEDTKTNKIISAARKAGALGSTVINNARGEGIQKTKTFFDSR